MKLLFMDNKKPDEKQQEVKGTLQEKLIYRVVPKAVLRGWSMTQSFEVHKKQELYAAPLRS